VIAFPFRLASGVVVDARTRNVDIWPSLDLRRVPQVPDRFLYGYLPPRLFEEARVLVVEPVEQGRDVAGVHDEDRRDKARRGLAELLGIEPVQHLAHRAQERVAVLHGLAPAVAPRLAVGHGLERGPQGFQLCQVGFGPGRPLQVLDAGVRQAVSQVSRAVLAGCHDASASPVSL